jgi:hypothetical protein
MLDLVPVSVGLCVVNPCGWARWWGKRDQRRVGGRNDGGVVVRGEHGVIIAVEICINKGKMPIVGSSWVTPAIKNGGACLVIGLDIVLGEGDCEVCVAKWGNADWGSGEG